MENLVNKVVEVLAKEGVAVNLIDNYGDFASIFVNGVSINLFENGEAALVNEDGDTIKVYKKLGSLAKAVAKM